jgi:hypothetical protein
LNKAKSTENAVKAQAKTETTTGTSGLNQAPASQKKSPQSAKTMDDGKELSTGKMNTSANPSDAGLNSKPADNSDRMPAEQQARHDESRAVIEEQSRSIPGDAGVVIISQKTDSGRDLRPYEVTEPVETKRYGREVMRYGPTKRK